MNIVNSNTPIYNPNEFNSIWQPTPKQLETFKVLLHPKVNELFYGGAMRGGKSFLGVGANFAFACYDKNFAGAIFRETLPALKRSIMPIVNYFLSDLEMNKYFSLNKSEMKLYGDNGSIIHLLSENKKGDPNYDAVRGLPLNLAFIDEICVEQAFYDLLLTRIGTNFICKLNGLPLAKILSSSNPNQTWVKEYFYENWKNKTLREGLIYVSAKVSDNPHAPNEWIEQQRQMLPPHLFKMFINGNWDVVLEKFFDADKIKIYTNEEFDSATRNLQFNYVVDCAFSTNEHSDYTAIIQYASDRLNNLFIKDVHRFKADGGTLPEKIFNYVISTNTNANPTIEIEGFGGGKPTAAATKKYFRDNGKFWNVDEYFFPKLPNLNLSALKKEERAGFIVNFVQSGRVIVQEGNFNRPFLNEIKAFPNGAHDDMIDCLVMSIFKVLYPSKKGL